MYRRRLLDLISNASNNPGSMTIDDLINKILSLDGNVKVSIKIKKSTKEDDEDESIIEKEEDQHPLIYLVRHGATTDVDNNVHGWLNIPLSGKGKAEAQEVGEKLASNDIHIDRIYSSDMKRTEETARIIGSYLGIDKIIPVFDLRSWNSGVYEGKPVKQSLPELHKYVENPNEKIPDGESFNDFRYRFLSYLSDMIWRAKKNNEVYMLVAHYRNLKITKAWIAQGAENSFDIDTKDFLEYDPDISPTSVFVLFEDEDGDLHMEELLPKEEEVK